MDFKIREVSGEYLVKCDMPLAWIQKGGKYFFYNDFIKSTNTNIDYPRDSYIFNSKEKAQEALALYHLSKIDTSGLVALDKIQNLQKCTCKRDDVFNFGCKCGGI